MTVQEIYKKETGKSPFHAVRTGFYTEEYVVWLKEYVKTSNDFTPKLFREYARNKRKDT